MTKINYIYLFLLLCSFSFAEIDEVEQYNLEIKDMMTSDYSSKATKRKRKRSNRPKWFAEDFFNAVDHYFQEKDAQYQEYKRDLEKKLSDNLNSNFVPKSMDSNLDVIVKLDENTENIKLKYRYTPELIKESYLDLGLEEEEFKISYVYEKPIDGLGGYFFNSVGYIFDKSVKNILEISKMKVK